MPEQISVAGCGQLRVRNCAILISVLIQCADAGAAEAAALMQHVSGCTKGLSVAVR